MPGLLSDLSFPMWLDTEVVSAHKAEQLRQAVLRIHAVQHMPLAVFCTAVSHWPWGYQRNPVTIWRGAVTWRSSATTLTVVVDWSGSVLSGDRVRVRVQTTNHTFTPATGLNTFVINASFADLTVVPIEIQLTSTSRAPGGHPNPSPNWPNVFVRDVFISPVQPSSSYPSVTPFGDVTSVRLNGLTSQLFWLYQAYGMHIRPVPVSLHREQGNRTGFTDRIRWLGSFIRVQTHTHIRVIGHVVVTETNHTESMVVTVNGSTVAQWNIPTTPGVHYFELIGSVAFVAANTRAVVDIYQTKTAPANTVSPNLFSIVDVSLVAQSTSPPSLPGWTSRLSMTYADLKTRFDALRVATESLRATYLATTAFWQRQFAGAARTAKDEFIFDYVEPIQPYATYRVGEELIVYGEQAKLVTGSLEYDPKVGNEPVAWRGSVEISLLSGNATEQAFVSFDKLKFPPVGSLYFVRGKRLFYVAERLGVV